MLTTPRRRHYSPRPERVSVDWPSCWRIAVAIVVLSFVMTIVLWFAFLILGAGLAAVVS